MTDTAAEKPDAALFVKGEYPNEFIADFSVRGTISMTIHAATLSEAKERAREMAEDDEFGHELDEVSDVALGYVAQRRPMFLVLRDGANMRVSHLAPGDQPRKPDDRGF